MTAAHLRPDRPARPLFVTHSGMPGGAELSLLDIAAHFAPAAGAELLLLADGPVRAMAESRGIPVRLLEAGRSVTGVGRSAGITRGLQALPKVWRAARRLAAAAVEFDVLYANSQKAFVVAALAGRFAGCPVIWHLRDILTAEHFSGVNRRVVVFLANRLAARVVANSRATADAFVAAGGKPELVSVVHNGIDPAPFDAVTDDEIHRVRAEFDLPPGPLVAVFGRLAPWKGQHVLLDALAALPGVNALIVGDALFGETDYATSLRDRAAALRLGGRVRFLGHRNDVAALMGAVDVVVHTSVAPEPFGRVLVEAMLAGRPVVASRAGGVSEIIEHRQTGLLFDPGNPAALAKTITELLRGGSETLATTARARHVGFSRFSVRRMFDEVAGVIAAVVSSKTITSDPTSPSWDAANALPAR